MPTVWASSREIVPTPWVRAWKKAFRSSMSSYSSMRFSISVIVSRHFWAQPAGMS
jgi:hypothetical protein